ncbi:uncharacterized protein DSM5745_03925 [Aspergillus mulundensis]|uniref:Uncharacterized protein n=1 Tax=Aspergillus mulundensis TaxID=1810919 RepID=A0A3D8SB57_9EURO|nr:hypothetical protein DSM5745_03925 [Aspergillus mulundensis]RDW83599.1 hypothetical protein DSM5745_03925 [Aspergillus mulundensis]
MTTVLKSCFWPHALSHAHSHRYLITYTLKRRAAATFSTNADPNIIPPWMRPLRDIDETLLEPVALKKGAARWGFALFRCNYDDKYTSNWKRMVGLLDETVRRSLELEEPDRLDLLPTHQLSIIEDPVRLDGASSHVVRDAFTQWTEKELARILEHPMPTKRTDGMQDIMGPRFNFCIFVDDICLESLDETPGRPVVKMLIRDWEKPADPMDVLGPYKDPIYRLCDDHGYEDGVSDDPGEDVGWMYIQVCNYVEYFNRFVLTPNWDVWYRRPPGLENWGSRVMLPGGWRKKA